MNSHLKPTCLFLAALCVCLVFSASPLAHSQDSPATAQQEQGAQSGKLCGTDTHTNKQICVPNDGYYRVISREETYDDFIRQFGEVDARIQKEVEEGKEPEPWPLWLDRKSLGIGEDDFNALYIIVVEAYHRIKANDDELFSAPIDNSAVIRHESKWVALSQAHDQKQTEIIHEVEARLKQVLTDEGSKSADTYIYRWYDGGTIFPNNPPPPKQNNPSITPAPAEP